MKLRCLASTRDVFHGSSELSTTRETALHSQFIERQRHTEYTYPELQRPYKHNHHHQYNTVSRLQWLNDGASLFSVSEDNGLRVYITSPTLLEDDNELLLPFTRSFHSSPIITTELHPEASPYTGSCPLLVSSNDVPLKLIDLIPAEDSSKPPILSIYNTQHSHTEKYFKIHSLKFTSDATFAAGMSSKVLLFDVNRPDMTGYLDCRGIVSCFENVESEFHTGAGGVMVGTFSNWVTMFGDDGTRAMETKLGSGNGVSQIMESTNGKYVFVITRNSETVSVLDVRMGLQLVEELGGFECAAQRIYGDILPKSQGLLVGTSTGTINFYEDAEMARSTLKSLEINTETSIPSVVVNPKEPSVMAYSIGDRNYDKPEIRISCLE